MRNNDDDGSSMGRTMRRIFMEGSRCPPSHRRYRCRRRRRRRCRRSRRIWGGGDGRLRNYCHSRSITSAVVDYRKMIIINNDNINNDNDTSRTNSRTPTPPVVQDRPTGTTCSAVRRGRTRPSIVRRDRIVRPGNPTNASCRDTSAGRSRNAIPATASTDCNSARRTG